MKKYTLVPSILGANFVNLKNEVQSIIDSGTNWLHYDVMDFHFVPNLTFGAKILKDIVKEFPNINIDIHFMVEIKNDLDLFLKDFLDCKPKSMTMHIESLKKRSRINEFISICKMNNVRAFLAISPDTKVIDLIEFLDKVDGVLVMSVYPGFGGQEFIPKSLEKIAFLVNYRLDKQLDYLVEVDGGINESTVKLVQNSGVDMIVAGSYFFNSKNKQDVAEKIINYEE